MEGTSLNVVQNLINQLKQVVPQAITEDKIDFDALKTLVGEGYAASGERYALTWAGKTDAYKVLQAATTGTLNPDPEKSINWDETENVLIEGENLEVLKVLQKSYYGKIKMIYIDPPYNTGNDSFIYPDKFSESKEDYLKRIGDKDDEGILIKQGLFRKNSKESGQFHSNWLNMMLPRLFLARNLLKEDGVIFIHIDENEVSNLTLLMNEVFGEENHLGNIVWDKGNPKGDAKGIGYQHELIIVYAKNSNIFFEKNDLKRRKKNADRIIKKAAELYRKLNKIDIPENLKNFQKIYPDISLDYIKYAKKVTNEDINKDFNNWINKQDFTGGERAYNKIDEQGNVYRLVSMAWPNKKKAPEDYFTPILHPVTKKYCPVPQRGWRLPSESIKKLLKEGQIIFGNDESVQPQRKYLLRDNLYENLPSVLFFGGSDDDLLKKLGLFFDNPKPYEFSKNLINSVVNGDKDEIVLDFFAGSGTTAQAVLDLNEQDGGKRRFICVQLSEAVEENSEAQKAGFETIADITQKRIKRVIEKIEKERNGTLEMDKRQSIGFRKYTLEGSNFKIWRGDVATSEEELKQQLDLFKVPQRANATTENILWELLIKNGYLLTEKVQVVTLADGETIYHTQDKRLALVLDTFTRAVQDELLKIKPKAVLMLDTLFTGRDNDKTNVQLKLEDNGINFKSI